MAARAPAARGKGDGGGDGNSSSNSVFADALHAAQTMTIAYDAMSRACVDSDLADGVCALRRLQGARGLLAVGKRAAVAARTWAACLSLCSPIDDMVEMQLALVLQALSAKLSRACALAEQAEPTELDASARVQELAARLRVRREYVRLLDAWNAMPCSVLPAGTAEKLESHMTAAKKAQSLTDRYEQQVKRERAQREQELDGDGDEAPPDVAGESAAKRALGDHGRAFPAARAGGEAARADGGLRAGARRVAPRAGGATDCATELVAALDGSERDRRLQAPGPDAAHDSERTTALQATLASMVVADTALRRTRSTACVAAVTAAAQREIESSVRSRSRPRSLRAPAALPRRRRARRNGDARSDAVAPAAAHRRRAPHAPAHARGPPARPHQTRHGTNPPTAWR